jgi:Dna[CI] antecedent, DciA
MPSPRPFVQARDCMPGALGALLERQPLTPAKVAFAWQMAVGPALARQTSVRVDGSILRVRSGDARWSREIERSHAVIIERLRTLLGNHVVSELICENPSSSAPSVLPRENSSAR